MKKFISLSCAVCLLLNLVCVNVKVDAKEETKVEGYTISACEDRSTESTRSYATQSIEDDDTEEVLVKQGQTYEVFVSEADVQFKFVPTSKDVIFDAILYSTIGSIKQTIVDSTSTIIVKSGEKFKISPKIDITINVSKKIIKTCKFINEPIFTKVNIDNTINYEFRNELEFNVPITIKDQSNPKYKVPYNIVTYNGSNEILSFFEKKTGDFNCNVNNRFRISAVNENNKFSMYIPYECRKFIKEVKEPALYYWKVKKGENIRILGDEFEKTVFKSTDETYSSGYDIVKYNSFNKYYYVASDVNVNTSINTDIVLNRNDTARISALKGDLDIYLPYEYRNNYEKTNMPALHEMVIKKGESYNFKSNETVGLISTTDVSLSGNRYDIVVYDQDKNVTKVEKDSYKKFMLNPNETARLTTSAGVQVRIHVPYEERQCYTKASQPAVYALDIEPNKYYEINNTSDKFIQTSNSSDPNTSICYDYIKYSNQVNMKDAAQSKTGSIKLEPKDKVKIGVSRNNNMFYYVPYEYRNMIKEVDTPVFEEFVVKDDGKYRLYNTTGGDLLILSNAQKMGSRYSLAIIYGEDKKSAVRNYQTGNFTLKANEAGDIQKTLGNEIVYYLPYGVAKTIFKAEDVNKDGKINTLDISKLATEYNKKIGDKTYTSMVDLNYDGIVDLYDLVSIARKIG